MAINTLAFVFDIIHFFEAAKISLWLFGGWAEELWQITPPRSHRDIDFLYPADSFQGLDQYIDKKKGVEEIQSKRFSHKRAIIYRDVMIEFLFVKQAEAACYTDFFSGQYRLEWPRDLLFHSRNVSGYNIPIASKPALLLYRQRHRYIEQAYQRICSEIASQKFIHIASDLPCSSNPIRPKPN